jgi:predicted negative regulator of RcsB-dependent stress response
MERAALAEQVSAELDHPATRAYALHHVSLLYLFAQRIDLVSERAAELLQVANANDYPIWRALALVMQSLARIAAGEPDEGVAQLEHGMVLYQGETTPPIFWPLLLTLQATGYAMAGRFEQGLGLVDEALSFFQPDEALSFDTVILRGDLLLGRSDAAGAAEMYGQAMEAAGDYGARMPELRSATRLAQLAKGTPGEAEASEALQAVYATFTEGFDTADLVAAQEVMGTG